MENSIDDDIMRSNLIYNLSRDDEFSPLHDSEIGTDGDDTDDGGDSESTNSDNDEDDEEYVPTAPWFTEEATSNKFSNSSGAPSNLNSLTDDLFVGQCFVDKQTAINAIQTSHIRDSRNYRVSKSDTTRFEAKCIVDECPWRIRVIKRKSSGYFEITKLPAEHTCLLRTLQRDHKKLSSSLIASVIKQQVRTKVQFFHNHLTYILNCYLLSHYSFILDHGESILKSA